MKTKPLTKAQRAMCQLATIGAGSHVVKIVGRNHPTVAWWRRKTGIDVWEGEAVAMAMVILKEDNAIIVPQAQGQRSLLT